RLALSRRDALRAGGEGATRPAPVLQRAEDRRPRRLPGEAGSVVDLLAHENSGARLPPGLIAQQLVAHSLPFSALRKSAFHALDPVLERDHLVGEEFARRLIGQLSVRELARRHADEYFGLHQPVHAEPGEDAAQVVLPPRSTN